MATDNFKRVYGTGDQAELHRIYDAWAETYDTDLLASGYVTPGRVARALAEFLHDKSAPVFDFACGTGLSGAALAAEGFTVIDGVDLSAAMLDRARDRSVYRHLRRIGEDEDPGLEPGQYAAITAVAAISPGAAPAAYLDRMIAGLAPGGLFAFSYNDQALEDEDYSTRLAAQIQSGAVRVLFEEWGDHFTGRGSHAVVYVLEKT